MPSHRAAVDRRAFLATAGGLVAATACPALGAAILPKKYRVAVIGHTGRGDYGHGLDTVWLQMPNCQIVGAADASDRGLAAAVKRLSAPQGFSDYRKMLDETRPELLSVCPRWVDQHRDMVVAAAERGVRGIYLEKPLARTLAEADEMVEVCRKNKVKLVVAHQTRYSPKLKVVEEVIRSGRLGKILELRARGKEDSRGGAEDLWVLGTHVLNLMNVLGGAPHWCFATLSQSGKPVTSADVKPGAEGIGPLAGDEVHAIYRLSGGATGYFDSLRQAAGRASRFGIAVYGSEGIVEMGTGYMPPAVFLPDSSWSPGRTGKAWVAVSSAGVGQPEPLKEVSSHAGNMAAASDLIDAVENDRQPKASLDEARTATEMIVAVFESHRQGGPVKMPLDNRRNPLAMLPDRRGE